MSSNTVRASDRVGVVYIRDQRWVPVGCLAFQTRQLESGEFEVKCGYSSVHDADYCADPLVRLQAIASTDGDLWKAVDGRCSFPSKKYSRDEASIRLRRSPVTLTLPATVKTKDVGGTLVPFREEIFQAIASHPWNYTGGYFPRPFQHKVAKHLNLMRVATMQKAEADRIAKLEADYTALQARMNELTSQAAV